jgi:hypothetical protein
MKRAGLVTYTNKTLLLLQTVQIVVRSSHNLTLFVRFFGKIRNYIYSKKVKFPKPQTTRALSGDI